MTLFELFAALGILIGAGVGFAWGWDQGLLWAAAGAIIGVPVGLLAGVFSAFALIVIQHWQYKYFSSERPQPHPPKDDESP